MPRSAGKACGWWLQPSPGSLRGIRNFCALVAYRAMEDSAQSSPRPVSCGHLWGWRGAPVPQASGGGGLLAPRRFVWLEKEHPPVLTIHSIQRGWIPRFLFRTHLVSMVTASSPQFPHHTSGAWPGPAHETVLSDRQLGRPSQRAGHPELTSRVGWGLNPRQASLPGTTTVHPGPGCPSLPGGLWRTGHSR